MKIKRKKKSERKLDTTKIDRLLSSGYSLRRKRISGVEYAYAQRGRHFVSLGHWQPVEAYLEERQRSFPERSKSAKELKVSGRSSVNQRFQEHRAKLKDLENEAAFKPSKATAYVQQVLPLRYPLLWSRLTLFSNGDLKNSIKEAFSRARAFDLRLQDAVITNKEQPDFYRYVVDAINNWIQSCIDQKRPSLFRPVVISQMCTRCSSPLVVVRDALSDFHDYSYYCKKCENEVPILCIYCRSKLLRSEQGERQALRCERCGGKAVLDQSTAYDVPETDDGKSLEENIDTSLRVSKRLGVVHQYEHNKQFFKGRPGLLYNELRKAGVSGLVANSTVLNFLVEVDWDKAVSFQDDLSMRLGFPFSLRQISNTEFDSFWKTHPSNRPVNY